MKPLIALACALIASLAAAGITSTPKPAQYLIRLADKTYEQNKVSPKTLDECHTRAKAIIPEASCVTIEPFANAGTCTDVPKKLWPIEKDAAGFVIKPRFKDDGFKPGSTTEYQFLVEDYVPGTFPDCWVVGWRIALEEDFRDVIGETLAENTDEPVPMEGATLIKWLEPGSEETRHHQFICYPTDTLPCPEQPERKPGACGWYWESACGGPGVNMGAGG